jgi:metal-responsive CopG/Arc/MetJ family transcriptional regulator
MEQRNQDIAAVILRLPKAMLSELDRTAELLRMNRTEYIRKSLTRNLEFSRKNEIPLVQNPAIQSALRP